MNSKDKLVMIIAIIGVLGICVVPLFLVQDSEFAGADGQAMAVIGEIDGAYEPWIESVWEPPGGETESLLFALQAAIGSGVFFYIIGFFVGSGRHKRNE